MATEKRVRPNVNAEVDGRQPTVGCRPVSKPARHRHSLLASVFLVSVLGTPQHANADWPQILGPNRNGEAVDQRLPSTLSDPIDLAWSAKVGQGYAGPVSDGERVWLFHRVGESERLEAFEAATGRSLFRRDFDANYRGGIDSDIGPRCAPVISGEQVVVFGAAGAIHVVDHPSGRLRWSRDLYDELGGKEGYFGAGSTPLVLADRIIVNVGGRNSAGVIALDRSTGKTLWQATSEAASYASPTRLTQNGKDAILLVARLNALLIDPTSGTVLAKRGFGQRGPTVNAATPLVIGNRAFLTASYGVGAALIELDSKQLAAVWENDSSLSSQYNTPVHHDGFLYGIHGREDIGPAELRCVELATGKVAWAQPKFGVAHAILAGNRVLLLKIDGTLVLIEATPTEFQPLATTRYSSAGNTRAIPALCDGRLFFRDAKQLVAIALPQAK